MTTRLRPGPTLTLAQARSELLYQIHTLEPRRVSLRSADGCTLAAPIRAPSDVPLFANAAMDGFAVRAQDTQAPPTRLRVVGRALAGRVSLSSIGPGEAVEVATGGLVPGGSDAVCVVERTIRDGTDVILQVPVKVGDNVRQPGEDILQHSLVFDVSTVLGPPHVGVLASLGLCDAMVYPKAKVGVVATGDELSDGSALALGQIYESNRVALLAAVRAAGCEGVDLGIVGDDKAAIADVLMDGAEMCDVILTSGGVSVGVADHMKTVLTSHSRAGVHWMEIAIKPAKPFGFAILAPSEVPVLCVPGNPVAALVSFELLVRPALRRMMGHQKVFQSPFRAIAEESFHRHRDGKIHFVRAFASLDGDGSFCVHPLGGQGSHHLHAMATANALAVLPDGEGIERGAPLRILLTTLDQFAEAAVSV